MQEQNKSLLSAIKAYIEICPFLSDIDLHIDRTESEPVNYSIQSAGLTKIKTDVLGNQTWQYNVILQSREYTTDDLERLNASTFTEDFIFWVDDNNENDILPELADKFKAIQITADNGICLYVDDNGDRGIYQIQIHLLFEREVIMPT